MCELHSSVRERTDALDAAGNTTAAIGKGFAIGSACLVGLALFGAFVTRVTDILGQTQTVDLLEPITFAGLLIGSMIPYWFSALTMKSVGQAANAMVIEIKRQFDLNPNLLIPNHPDRPDYEKCIGISTEASLKEMVAPGCLVMLSPILCGVIFGTKCVTGLLAGGIASGIQMALSSSNTGGAWDNAKKYISGGNMNAIIAQEEPETVVNGVVATKKSQIFKAAVTGDTVGDPLKDTSGPALNIVMKLMAIISVVFAPLFCAINNGGGIINNQGTSAVSVVVRRRLLAASSVVSADGELAALGFGLAIGAACVVMTQRIFSSSPRVASKAAANDETPALVCKAEAVEGTAVPHMASNLSPVA